MAITFPNSPSNGDTHTAANGLVYSYDGEKWTTAAVDSTIATTTIAANPPAGASAGDLWFDSDNGQLYVYYQDTDSSQWVAITVSTSILDGSIDTLKLANDSVTALKVADDLLTSSGSTFPSPTLEGQLHYNTGDGRLYIAVQNAGATLIWVDASPAINPQTATLQETTDAGATTTTDITVANVTSTGVVSARNTVKAWVNYDGVNNTIRASYNVSSVTDNGNGDYTVNFTTPMADTNYVVTVTGIVSKARTGSSDTYGLLRNAASNPTGDPEDLTTSGVRVIHQNSGGTSQDSGYVGVTVYNN